MKHKALRVPALILAALVSAAMPCLAAMPEAKVACPMAGCGDAEGASFDAARPCCCAGSPLPAGADPGSTLRAPAPAFITQPASAATCLLVPIAAARATEGRDADHVPLFLLNASLLI